MPQHSPRFKPWAMKKDHFENRENNYVASDITTIRLSLRRTLVLSVLYSAMK